ncbi:hypothetical protein C8R43DRAFT_859382, partial [Mycena crocata]
RLPPEISGEIFRLCVAPTDTPPSGRYAPLMCLNVCRAWSDIAHTTPHLWTEITVSPGRDWRLKEPMAEAWFARSGSLPVSLTV